MTEAGPHDRAPEAQVTGLVTTMHKADLLILQKAMTDVPVPVEAAGIFAPAHMVTDFAAYFPPEVPLSFIILRLNELASVGNRYKLCFLSEQVAIADIIEPIRNMSIQERLIFCASPASYKTKGMDAVIAAYARCVGDNRSGGLFDLPELGIEVLNEVPSVSRLYLNRLEMLHKGLILYTWLSYRFVGIFVHRDLAFHVKELVEQRIDQVITQLTADSKREQSRLDPVSQAVSRPLSVSQPSSNIARRSSTL